MIAKVVINSKSSNLNRTFDYNIPDKFKSDIHLGSRVLIPFGKRKEDGYIISFAEKSEYECKDIIRVLPSDRLSKEQIKLAKWMSLRYFASISECIKLMVNPEIKSKNIENIMKEKRIKIIQITENSLNDDVMQKYISELLENIKNNEIKEHIQYAGFTDEENIISKYSLTEKQKIALDILILNGNISYYEKDKNNDSKKNGNDGNNDNDDHYSLSIKMQLKEYMDILPVSSGVLNALVKKGILEKVEEEQEFTDFGYNRYKQDVLEKDFKLNEEQEKVYNNILDYIDMGMYSKHLIFGVTGSGKTEIYIQLIREVLKKGKTAIVLVPEISITPQMISRFTKRFGKEISVLHSRLGNRQRYEEWNRIKRGESKIVIGVRSAIFAPLKDIGIIIIDEEQDSSYISSMNPKYNAKEVANEIAKANNCPIVLGSATPLVETYYMAKQEDIVLHELKNRVEKVSLPVTEIIDMKKEKNIISERLKELLLENHKNNKQSILFLNRRGYSSVVMCTNCGYKFECKRCNIAMTYHKEEGNLKCHYCGYTKKYPHNCPNCGAKLKNSGIGTEQLEKIINEQLPELKTIRMDLDTTKTKMSHEEILEKFQKENIDVLIGTQMVTKGHDFPNVTLSAVVLADGMLNIENYMATENTFQNIVQLTGRAGRKEAGRAIIQTYNPEDIVINIAKDADYNKFYEFEIAGRRVLNYPPFKDILSVSVLSYTEDKAIFYAKQIRENLQKMKQDLIQKEKDKLEKIKDKEQVKVNNENNDKKFKKIQEIQKNIESLENMEIMQETPYKVDKVKNQYRWKVIIKCNYNAYIAKALTYLTNMITKTKDPIISAQLNPLDI